MLLCSHCKKKIKSLINLVNYSSIRYVIWLTRLQLKYGDWDAVLKESLLVSRDKLNSALISYQNTYKTWQPCFCTNGIDPASTGSDKFAMSCLVYFNNGNIVLVNLDATPSAFPEERLKNL